MEPTKDLIALIALAVALAAYVATVRHRLIDKKRTGYAKAMIVPDLILLVSAFCLGGVWGVDYFGYKASACAERVGVWTLGAAIVVLALFHVYEWFRPKGTSHAGSAGEPGGGG